MDTRILRAVWGTQDGYVFVPTRLKREGEKDVWDEGRPYKYPEEFDTVIEHIETSEANGKDTYWCPLVFDKKRRVKECAKPNQALLWADLDTVDPTTLGELRPSIAWRSSDERFQGLWLLDTTDDVDTVESVNRDLTYYVGADPSGWDVTQVLRVPGTKNFKYDPPQQGKLLWAKRVVFDLEKVSGVVSSPSTEPVESEGTLEDLLKGWHIPERAMELLRMDESDVEVGERSDRLWEIEALLVEAGMPILDIVQIIHLSPWNKFKGRRGEMEQIYREVTKVEQHVKLKARESSTPITLDPEAEKLKRQTWAIPYVDFASKRIEKPSWLVDEIWQVGTYGMIAGEPKTYKSVQATDLAISVASGRAYLGEFAVRKSGAVLYIQEENNESTVQDRVFKIANGKGLLQSSRGMWSLPDDIPLYFSNNYGVDLTQTHSRELIESTIQEVKPVLMILDPLYMMLGKADENSAKEVGEVLRWLTYLRNEYGLSIMICHHYNKGGASTRGGQRVRGSGAFHAWVESALYVKTTTEKGKVSIEREFRAFPSTEDLVVKFELGDPGDLHYKVTIEREESDTTYGIRKEEICTILSSSPRTEEELRALSKFTRADLRNILKELESDGLVVKDDPSGGRGKKAKYVLTLGGEDFARR